MDFICLCTFRYANWDYTLDETLSVKGYYLIGTLFLTMSCFVLQKTIRDNEEDNERFPKNKPLDKE